ncbi:HAD domain-containing protein [Streptomyces sp. TRM 70361]|uniref:HAD domain-containing protein n=1 Tax=Streptomyces sp. TRM 70361 TaxID=3116553 RepID=UPI002E7B8F19|nr:HAD domain-containing protein [Streptomyces sp. TRM 70361]MEE1939778.1 HAD domain-containing protein [Streptomyces sp. TRM 70361]
MTSSAERPVLFLDIDGPLIPFGPSFHRPQEGDSSGSAEPHRRGNPLLDRLDPAVGPRLTALGCDMVWASTWMDDANEAAAPRLGLPTLPVLRWPDTFTDEGPRGLHWKTRHLVEWAGHRRFIWVDDEISDMDRLWVAAQHPGPSLLHRVDPGVGLTDDDFDALTDWLRPIVPTTPGRAGS